MSINSVKLSPTKQLLIIGNGFDKHLGLKSLYVEYYFSLTENEQKNNIFTYLASNKNYNWADVESLLLKCLIIIKKLDAQTVKNYFLVYKSDSIEQILSGLVSSNNSQKIMTISEEKELIKRVLKFFFLSSLIFPDSLLEFCQEPDHIFQKKLMDLMMDQVKNFESGFKDYLTNEIKNFPEVTYNIKSQKFIDELIKSGVHFTDENSNFLLSFNYTPLPTSTELFNLRGSNNVHGTLLDNIILGIDHHDYQEFMEFTKTFRIMTELSQEPLKIYDNSVDIIKFYGHSLSEADYSYFVSIFDAFNIYNSDIVLKFYYDDFDKQSHKKEQVERVYKLINHYGETFDNKDHGQNLLHKLVLEKRISVLKMEDDVWYS